MKKNSKRKATALIAVLIIVVLVSIQGVIFFIRNRNARSQKVSEIGNNKKEEMLADEFVDAKKNPTAEEKVEMMNKLSENWDTSRVEVVEIPISEEDPTTVKVPVPKGYKASKVTGKDEQKGENTLDGGLVIYEGDKEVTGEFGSEEVKKAQKERNQWVWVPVYDPEDMYGIDKNGKMWGKLYNFNNNGRSNHNWSETDNIMSIIDLVSPINCGREPDMLTNHYDRDVSLPNYLSEIEKEELDKEIRNYFEKTIESIKKYGGFYIGRYETGGVHDDIAKIVKMNTDISKQSWYTMYKKCQELGANNNVVTCIIFGNQWDRTLQWLVDTDCKTYKQVSGEESNTWGNYEGAYWNKYTDIDGNIKDCR